MEPDQPAGEPTGEPAGEPCDDPKPAAEEQHLQQQSATHTAARSYECTFCKRGFTNAQALGGHMNIHRKDKTKFKHSTATQNEVGDSPSATRPRLSATTATTAAGGNPFSISPSPANWFSTAPQDDKKPLPLFGHRASDAPAGGSRNTRQENELQQPPSPAGEVDLELRLGHVEASPESSPENKNTTTRKFF